jgi:hypothetical protein
MIKKEKQDKKQKAIKIKMFGQGEVAPPKSVQKLIMDFEKKEKSSQYAKRVDSPKIPTESRIVSLA